MEGARHEQRDLDRKPDDGRRAAGVRRGEASGDVRLAVDRGGKDSETDFFRVSVWDRQAQVCADYLAKGRKIALEGRLKYRTWEDEGKKRSAVEVVAYRVEFLSRADRPGAEVVPFEAAVA